MDETDDQPEKELPEKETQLMDSLLRHALENENNLENKLERLRLSLIEEPVTSRRSDTRRHILSGWGLSFSTIAALLIAFAILFPLFTRNTALAALERSIRAELLPIDRHYEVTLDVDWIGGGRYEFAVDLYIRQDQVLAHTRPDHRLGELWVYKTDGERLVIPASGEEPFRIQDDPKAPGQPPVVGAPLVISTILEEMRDGYELQRIGTQTLTHEGTGSVTCDHLVGVRHSSTAPLFPERVELWSDLDQGIVQRLEIEFGPDHASKAHSLSVQLIGTPQLSDDFFEPSKHTSFDLSDVEFKEENEIAP